MPDAMGTRSCRNLVNRNRIASYLALGTVGCNVVVHSSLFRGQPIWTTCTVHVQLFTVFAFFITRFLSVWHTHPCSTDSAFPSHFMSLVWCSSCIHPSSHHPFRLINGGHLCGSECARTFCSLHHSTPLPSRLSTPTLLLLPLPVVHLHVLVRCREQCTNQFCFCTSPSWDSLVSANPDSTPPLKMIACTQLLLHGVRVGMCSHQAPAHVASGSLV